MTAIEESGLRCTGVKQPGLLYVMDPRWVICGCFRLWPQKGNQYILSLRAINLIE